MNALGIAKNGDVRLSDSGDVGVEWDKGRWRAEVKVVVKKKEQ